MKIVAVVVNVAFLAFSLLAIATDGPPVGVPYVFLTALVLLVPAATLFALLASRFSPPRDLALAGFNAVLFAAICVAVAQPHSSEPGYVPYAVLAAFTPGFSALFFLFRGRALPRAA